MEGIQSDFNNAQSGNKTVSPEEMLVSGVVVHNPMRVVANGDGSEFLFTLLRQPGMSDQQFADDQQAVENDLASLKARMESHT